MIFDKDFLDKLYEQAAETPRLRQNYDLRTSGNDTSQRMLNAVLPETIVPIHRHEDTSETVICLQGRLIEIFYEEMNPISSQPICPQENGGASTFNRGMDAQDVTPAQRFREVKRMELCPKEGRYGCQIPQGMWHTIEVIEPSVIFEAKDGAYKK